MIDTVNAAKVVSEIIRLEKLAGTTSGTTGGGASNNPYSGLSPVYSQYGVNPAWIAAYQANHGGIDPINDYGTSGVVRGQGWTDRRTDVQALDSALWDRDWAGRFVELHGKPPSDRDWNESYYDRERAKTEGKNPW